MRQRLAELKDRRPGVIEEVRGEGLMVGLKLKVPPADFADAALAQKLLVIPAGDNVVRLLPPLVVTEEEIAEGVRRLDAACAAVEERLAVADQLIERMNAAVAAPRHFLDLLDLVDRRASRAFSTCRRR